MAEIVTYRKGDSTVTKAGGVAMDRYMRQKGWQKISSQQYQQHQEMLQRKLNKERRESARERQTQQKQALLKQSGMEATTEAAEKAVLVSPKELRSVREQQAKVEQWKVESKAASEQAVSSYMQQQREYEREYEIFQSSLRGRTGEGTVFEQPKEPEPKVLGRTVVVDPMGMGMPVVANIVSVPPPPNESVVSTTEFEQRAFSQQERQRQSEERLGRIVELGSVHVSYVSKAKEKVTGTGLSLGQFEVGTAIGSAIVGAPFFVGESLAMAGEKAAITGKGLMKGEVTIGAVKTELGRAAVSQEFTQTYDITKPSGQATFIFAGFGALLPATVRVAKPKTKVTTTGGKQVTKRSISKDTGQMIDTSTFTCFVRVGKQQFKVTAVTKEAWLPSKEGYKSVIAQKIKIEQKGGKTYKGETVGFAETLGGKSGVLKRIEVETTISGVKKKGLLRRKTDLQMRTFDVIDVQGTKYLMKGEDYGFLISKRYVKPGQVKGVTTPLSKSKLTQVKQFQSDLIIKLDKPKSITEYWRTFSIGETPVTKGLTVKPKGKGLSVFEKSTAFKDLGKSKQAVLKPEPKLKAEFDAVPGKKGEPALSIGFQESIAKQVVSEVAARPRTGFESTLRLYKPYSRVPERRISQPVGRTSLFSFEDRTRTAQRTGYSRVPERRISQPVGRTSLFSFEDRTRTAQRTGLTQRQKAIHELRLDLSGIYKQRTTQQPKAITTSRTKPITQQQPITQQKPISIQEPISIAITIPVTIPITQPITEITPFTPPPTEPPTPPPTGKIPPPLIPILPLFPKGVKQVQGYSVIVRDEGRRLKANKKLLPKAEAEKLLFDVLDNSLSASGKIVEGKRKVPISRRSELSTGRFVDRMKFTRGITQKTRDLWVERPGHRLDTKGEVEGITAAKLLAGRRGTIKRGLFNL